MPANPSSGSPTAGPSCLWFLVACVAKGLTASRGERRTATAKPAAGGDRELEQLPIRTRNVRFHVKIESGT